jgi:hypothetical protein
MPLVGVDTGVSDGSGTGEVGESGCMSRCRGLASAHL